MQTDPCFSSTFLPVIERLARLIVIVFSAHLHCVEVNKQTRSVILPKALIYGIVPKIKALFLYI
jgi:hypothetical protein